MTESALLFPPDVLDYTEEIQAKRINAASYPDRVSFCLEHGPAASLFCPISHTRVYFRSGHITEERSTSSHFVHYGDGRWSPEVIFDPELGRKVGDCQYVGGESELHKAGKRLLMACLREMYTDERVKIEQELRIYMPQHGKYRIADVSVSSPLGVLEVHEVQFSPLTLEEFEARDADYSSRGISAVWWLGGDAMKGHELRRSIRAKSLSLGYLEEVQEGEEQ